MQVLVHYTAFEPAACKIKSNWFTDSCIT